MLLKPRSNLKLYLLIIASLVLSELNAQAQVETIKKTKEKTRSISADGGGGVVIGDSNSVTISLDGHTLGGVLPFDVPFNLIFAPSATDAVSFYQVSGIDCWYDIRQNWPDLEKIKADPAVYLKFRGSGSIDQEKKRYTIYIPGLRHSTDYFFVFVVKRTLTDDQQKAVVAALQPGLSKSVSEVSKNGTAEVSDAQFTALTTDAQAQATKAFASQGIKVKFGELSQEQHKTMLTALQNISTAYAVAAKHRDVVKKEVDLLRNADIKLRDFEVKYQQGIPDAANDNKVKALKNIFPLFPDAFNFPDGDAASKDSLVNNYIAACKELQDAAKLAVAAIPEFKDLGGNIVDFSEGLIEKYPRFVLDMQAVKAQNAAQTASFINSASGLLYSTSYITGTTTPGDFKTRSNNYLSADLGVALIPDLGLMTPYMGTNIYLRPINRDHSLTGLQFFERFSFLVGISVTSLSKTNYRSDLLGSNLNLITGAGFRVADFVRVNGGVAWYGQHAANPLNTNQVIGASFFVSLSFDIDVKTVFSSLFDSSKTALIH